MSQKKQGEGSRDTLQGEIACLASVKSNLATQIIVLKEEKANLEMEKNAMEREMERYRRDLQMVKGVKSNEKSANQSDRHIIPAGKKQAVADLTLMSRQAQPSTSRHASNNTARTMSPLRSTSPSTSRSRQASANRSHPPSSRSPHASTNRESPPSQTWVQSRSPPPSTHMATVIKSPSPPTTRSSSRSPPPSTTFRPTSEAKPSPYPSGVWSPIASSTTTQKMLSPKASNTRQLPVPVKSRSKIGKTPSPTKVRTPPPSRHTMGTRNLCNCNYAITPGVDCGCVECYRGKITRNTCKPHPPPLKVDPTLNNPELEVLGNFGDKTYLDQQESNHSFDSIRNVSPLWDQQQQKPLVCPGGCTSTNADLSMQRESQDRGKKTKRVSYEGYDPQNDETNPFVYIPVIKVGREVFLKAGQEEEVERVREEEPPATIQEILQGGYQSSASFGGCACGISKTETTPKKKCSCGSGKSVTSMDKPKLEERTFRSAECLRRSSSGRVDQDFGNWDSPQPHEENPFFQSPSVTQSLRSPPITTSIHALVGSISTNNPAAHYQGADWHNGNRVERDNDTDWHKGNSASHDHDVNPANSSPVGVNYGQAGKEIVIKISQMVNDEHKDIMVRIDPVLVQRGRGISVKIDAATEEKGKPIVIRIVPGHE